jgi:hypothetical protein
MYACMRACVLMVLVVLVVLVLVPAPFIDPHVSS